MYSPLQLSTQPLPQYLLNDELGLPEVPDEPATLILIPVVDSLLPSE